MMAKENRVNIAKYFVEQLKRLSLTISVNPIVLWNKIDAIMTDSASKNLKIIGLIMEMLAQFQEDEIIPIREPLHLLCCIHTLECFDRKMLDQIKEVC